MTNPRMTAQAEGPMTMAPPTPSRQLLVSLRNKLGDIRSMSGELLARVAGPLPSKDAVNQCATPEAVMIDLEILDREAAAVRELLLQLLNLI